MATLESASGIEDKPLEITLTGSGEGSAVLQFEVVEAPAEGDLHQLDIPLDFVQVDAGTSDPTFSILDPPTGDEGALHRHDASASGHLGAPIDTDASFSGDGRVVYVPPPERNTADGLAPQLGYTVDDGLVSPEQTVSVTIDAVGDPPTATAGPATTDEDTPVVLELSGEQVDGDPLVIVVDEVTLHSVAGKTLHRADVEDGVAYLAVDHRREPITPATALPGLISGWSDLVDGTTPAQRAQTTLTLDWRPDGRFESMRLKAPG